MSIPSPRRLGRAARTVAAAALVAPVLAAPACSSLVDDPAPVDTTPEEPLAPGEICTTPAPDQVRVRFEPSFVAVAPCKDASGVTCPTRAVNVVVDPDFCAKTAVRFKSSDGAIAPAPGDAAVTLRAPVVPLRIRGGETAGSATIEVLVPKGDGTDATATLTVDVIQPDALECAGTASTPLLGGGDSLRGAGKLAGATISLPEGADKQSEGSFLWGVQPFAADIACGEDAGLEGYVALGPAITFGPAGKVFQREVPLSVPVNPALLPDEGRWRHLRLAYSGPGFSAPRTIPVADPRVEKVDGQWAVTFKAPRLGTYQAVVKINAGTKARKRRLTHRAVIGVSMGGGGTAMMGLRHHDLFDVLAPLGGPVDWTWLLSHIEQNHLGGFRPIASGTQAGDIPLSAASCATSAECAPDETCLGALPAAAGKCVVLSAPRDPYEHPSTFNTWWYEYPRAGNGGQFSRSEYVKIFRDLALMFGNPNGENLSPGAENLPAGVRPDDPSQVGDHANGECKVWVEPLDGPDRPEQEAIAQSCPVERCSHPLTLNGYYDDEYNPDGAFPVITVCDGAPQNEALTPYANTWHPEGNQYPLELALAVDYNGNGVRDELEPIVRAGRERWDDDGEDGLPSAAEAGYAPFVNEDPAGDDYNAQYNPGGTEGDHRWQPGEAFDDVGLDGVAGTAQQPEGGWAQPGDGYDVGEGDGQLTVSSGLQRFWDHDPHSVVRRMTQDLPGGELTDAALARLDVWTDGGTRDLFNFMVDAQHLVGAFAARGRDVSYLTDFTQAPGLDPTKPLEFTPSRIVYEDLQGIVLQRYGKIDPGPQDIEDGSGQHVGTASEIAARLQTALYFIGSRWPEPELRQRVLESNDAPAEGVDECEVTGSCEFEFTSSFGRKGPVAVSLPPGYGHKDQQDRRYPVLFVLHGYGQEPQDLTAAFAVVRTWMNSSTDSMASRLPKAIIVYVDGRCRPGADGKAECIQGTLFADSARQGGVQLEQWWLELMDEVAHRYRTMGESEVDWSE